MFPLAIVAGLALFLGLSLATSSARSGDRPPAAPEGSNATAAPPDDWVYSGPQPGRDFLPAPAFSPQMRMDFEMSKAGPAGATLGLAVGGAKDVANFRENIANAFLPLPTDVTYEGLFYDYFFETGQEAPCPKLFCPSSAAAVSRDPFSGQEEYYLAVGLNSGVQAAEFSRKKLNLAVVLDISGSMGSPFDSYYYDRFPPVGEKPGQDDPDQGRSKMELAARSVVALLDHLRPGDRFGMVLFDQQAYLARPLAPLAEADPARLKAHVLEIAARGGTNLSAGMQLGTRLFDPLGRSDPGQEENRIVFLTDAMPNTGGVDDAAMLRAISDNARAGIHTTFVGIGLDLNTELAEAVTKARGANYYSVHSARDFAKRLDEEFDFMVTPLVFDLRLTLRSEDFAIERALGSPEADLSTGEVLRVNTLFPSAADERGVRGGLVLLKLRQRAAGEGRIALSATWEDRQGRRDGEEISLVFGAGRGNEFCDNPGLRKGILLARYAGLLRAWAAAERTAAPAREAAPPKAGILLPTDEELRLGRWERQSMPLKVSPAFRLLFKEFAAHFAAESAALGDPELEREAKVLARLAGFKD